MSGVAKVYSQYIVPNFIYDTSKVYCSADYVANISAFRIANMTNGIVNYDKGVALARPV